MTVSEVKGFGRTGGKQEVFRGSAYHVDFVPKICIVIVAPDTLLTSISCSTESKGHHRVLD
jgi:nitrogen regulatory protein P-II 1